MVQKEIRGGICHSINKNIKTNNKYIKDYDINKESPYVKSFDLNNLYGWGMSQKLPVNEFKYVDNISEFDESFLKSYNEESDLGYFLEVDVQYPEKLPDFHNDLPFLPGRMKSLFLIFMIKLIMLFT